MNSSTFKRFKALPLPFEYEDASPLPNTLPLDPGPGAWLSRGLPNTPVQGIPTLGHIYGRLDLDESSVDSGLGLDAEFECAGPRNFEGLLTGLILTNDSPLSITRDSSQKHATSNNTKLSRRNLFGCELTPLPSIRKNKSELTPSSVNKRARAGAYSNVSGSQAAKRSRQVSPAHSDVIKCALNREEQLSDDVIGDFTRSYCLPIIPGKHRDLQCLSPDTLAELLSGKFDDVTMSYTVVDCRYPYEFEGGQIKDAQNIWNRDLLVKRFFGSDNRKQVTGSSQRHVIIFHCEFSSERAPKMLRLLRQLDRDAHTESYPDLDYPELYLLDGGYKDFYAQHPDHCQPRAYKPMTHDDHVDDLKYFRRKSKSCTTGNALKGLNRQQRSFQL